MRDQLARVAGEDCALDSVAAEPYTISGMKPHVVVAPRTSTQAAAIMRLASSERWTVEYAGAGTRLDNGNRAHKVDVVLTSTRMNAVAEYEPADLVISVQSGVSLIELGKVVAEHNQFFAIDPAVAERATVGATIANASAGPLRFAHGTPRDQVLGLEVVTGDGRLLHFGGRVVKNVAGYDLVRLLVGSRGTLGFITSVHLRLKPLPEVDSTVVVATESLAALVELAGSLRAAHLDAVALEIISPVLARQVIGEARWTLLARLHGNAPAVTDATAHIEQLAGQNATGTIDANCWRQLAQLEAQMKVRVRIANLPASLPETSAAAMSLIAVAELQEAHIAAHAGDGIVRVLGSAALGDFEAAVLSERAAIEQTGGTLVVEQMPEGANVDAFGQSEGTQLMSQIKQAFDPVGVVAPGRFVV